MNARRIVIAALSIMMIAACAATTGAGEDAVAAGRNDRAESTTDRPAPTSVSSPGLSDAGSSDGVVGLPNPLGPGDHKVELNHDRRTRSYIVHVPPRVAVPAAVVVALHGGGGNGYDFQQQNGLDAVADREGFLAVYPEGTGILPNRLHTWNSGDSCCGFALDRNIDDVDFLRAVLRSLATQVGVDRGRVYMTGHSNGAMMAYRFAAEASELVTAIVPVGGALDLQGPVPAEAVAILHIHSKDDPRALYEGGLGPAFPGTDRGIHHEPVLAGVERWADWNGCSSVPQTVERRAGAGADRDHSLERLTWAPCDAGGAVQHLVLSGSGHGWPGVTAPFLVQRHLGPTTTLIDASEEVWAFVSQFDR